MPAPDEVAMLKPPPYWGRPAADLPQMRMWVERRGDTWYCVGATNSGQPGPEPWMNHIVGVGQPITPRPRSTPEDDLRRGNWVDLVSDTLGEYLTATGRHDDRPQ